MRLKLLSNVPVAQMLKGTEGGHGDLMLSEGIRWEVALLGMLMVARVAALCTGCSIASSLQLLLKQFEVFPC